MPIFGRTGISMPSSTKVFWPISGATQGVAGARMASTCSNRRSICCWIPAAEFLRLHHGGSGNQRAGDQPVAHIGIEIVRPRAQPFQMQRRAFGRGDDIGGAAGTSAPPGS